ncbi:hypothetical protein [Streptomyces sp. NPDC046942]|uniref:hypothetical protein n=1 Tax=Streptomyces sp. NPDC046942 TaxID=3155137 RepID=UPI0033E49D13
MATPPTLQLPAQAFLRSPSAGWMSTEPLQVAVVDVVAVQVAGLSPYSLGAVAL